MIDNYYRVSSDLYSETIRKLINTERRERKLRKENKRLKLLLENIEVIASGMIVRYTGFGSKKSSFEQYCIIPAGKDITNMREAEVIDYKFEDYENQEIEIIVRRKDGG